jgi:predicted DNA-binding transcriptional regulator AlpA
MEAAVMKHPKESEGRRRLPERYLGPSDVAELLGVPVATLYQWRSRRIGPPSFRVGRYLRYDPEAVRRWVDSLSGEVA